MMGIGRQLTKLRCCLLLLFLNAENVYAQSLPSFQYFYDDLGQLTKVVDSTGTVIEYVYDPVGNILQIKRSTVAPNTLAIFNFTPQRGGPGQTVTIQGQAFDSAPANDMVQFNGTADMVLSATATTLTVTVPSAATTGPISVTVAGHTVTSTTSFTVLPLPVITSLSRKSALPGTSFPNSRFPALTVSGLNFTPDTTFALAPVTNPPAASFGIPVMGSTGSSITMTLTVGSTTGTFALVATNIAGSSTSVPNRANRFTIVDPRSTADSDVDGVPDAIEAIFGTDPLDPTSFPLILSLPGQAESAPFTVLNQSARTAPTIVEAESPAFVVLNSSSAAKTFEAESPVFTVLNANVAQKNFEAESPACTILNSNSQAKTFEEESPAFTLLNGSPSLTSHEADSPAFTLNNSATAAVHNLQPTVAANSQHMKSGSVMSKARTKRRVSKSSRKKDQKVSTTVPVAATEPIPIGSSDKNSTESSSQQGAIHANQNQ